MTLTKGLSTKWTDMSTSALIKVTQLSHLFLSLCTMFHLMSKSSLLAHRAGCICLAVSCRVVYENNAVCVCVRLFNVQVNAFVCFQYIDRTDEKIPVVGFYTSFITVGVFYNNNLALLLSCSTLFTCSYILITILSYFIDCD